MPVPDLARALSGHGRAAARGRVLVLVRVAQVGLDLVQVDVLGPVELPPVADLRQGN